jgi:hypothetical protein
MAVSRYKNVLRMNPAAVVFLSGNIPVFEK